MTARGYAPVTIDADAAWYGPTDPRRLYPTKKPEGLLERIIKTATNDGQVVLDAYCGCGTSIVVAQKLNRKWVGIDITYQSISLVLRELEQAFGGAILPTITTDGIPRDMASALALAHKADDRLRKEFEKWSVLTYTNNRAVINEKKGADAGIDARAFFVRGAKPRASYGKLPSYRDIVQPKPRVSASSDGTSASCCTCVPEVLPLLPFFKIGRRDNAKIIFQVKSGGVKRGDIATLRGDMDREKAALAVLITLVEPSKPMIAEAKAAGQYRHEDMGRSYDAITIVTIKEIIEDGRRLEIPMSLEVLASAKRDAETGQMPLF